MESTIPSQAEVQSDLLTLGHAQMQELARVSGVPFTTLWKVRSGETTNPGLETVRKFMAHFAEVAKAKAA
jgi:predicted transcriptional regulator